MHLLSTYFLTQIFANLLPAYFCTYRVNKQRVHARKKIVRIRRPSVITTAIERDVRRFVCEILRVRCWNVIGVTVKQMRINRARLACVTRRRVSSFFSSSRRLLNKFVEQVEKRRRSKTSRSPEETDDSSKEMRREKKEERGKSSTLSIM